MSQEKVGRFKCEACETEFNSSEDLLTMKNIPHTGDQVVAGNSNVK